MEQGKETCPSGSPSCSLGNRWRCLIDAAHAADTRLLAADCTRLDVNEGDHMPAGNREHHRAEINVLAERDAADIRVHIL